MLSPFIASVAGESECKNELTRVRKELAECRLASDKLKEDNGRKAKLLATLKTARTSDESALEQWKAEVSSLEETCRR